MHGQDIISQSISNENLVIDEIYPNEEIDIQRVIQRFASAGNRRSMLL